METISPDALAARWGLERSTLDKWRQLKKGPPYLKLGGRVAYRLADIEAYETKNRQEPQA